MGEKFAANLVTGTGSMTVPIPTSPGRSGFGPQLALSYDSGSGNGPFGFGWTLPIPSITRKTDKGLPQYEDADESDVYILSGSEDLVPVLDPDGSRQRDDISAPGFTIHRYRPRVEGLFSRIERWTDRATGELHWRSITRENVTTLYGTDNDSRIFDPADPVPGHPARIFNWLIRASYDDKGNAILYEYSAEDDAGVDRTRISERNRTRTANRYLKRIKYGNRVSRLVQPDLTQATWLFEVVFDYDEGHYTELPLDQTRPVAEQHSFVRASSAAGGKWVVRPDPFSSYRPGFEVRTYRRCRRVLMFHRFPELGEEPSLVRAIEFDYADLYSAQPAAVEAELAHHGSTRFASFIQSVTQSGFIRDDTQAIVHLNGASYVTYLKRSLPALEFQYSKAEIQDQIRELDASTGENLPVGVDGATYQWVDLDGEGVSGILTEQAGAWFYKPNLGEGRFGALQVVRTKPSLFALASGGTQFLDLSGDGQLDVVSFAGPTPGFYERTQNEDWETFRAFRTLPNLRWDEPNLRFVDLDGDGHADILIAEDDVFTWYPSLAEKGFGPARQVRLPKNEERGPRLVWADGTQSIYLADLSGDGLTDLVRIRNGEVCYWPNLGYGRFGSKISMDNAPWFDSPDLFDQRRIRLADIDGSGTTDIIYLGHDGVRLYFNQSGNHWSGARRLPHFPRMDNLSSVTAVDLFGNGTACLVWSAPWSADARSPIRYIDLMGGQKPHLLIKSSNNFGAETQVEYASSTRFYLADKRAGKPWITRLPFPVHVVERMVTYDRISGNRFTTRYSYHHGYFDGAEREFRGFGMVEQQDTEELATLAAAGTLPAATNLAPASHVPPVLTKTWFHTGIYLGRDHVSDFFAGLLNANDVGEYYREPGLTDAQVREQLLPDTVMPPGLTLEEEREACRALKGMMLRQEVYALDGTEKATVPYTVVEQTFTLERLQPLSSNRHAVFFSHPREVLNHYYERNPADPRIQHTLTLQADEYGNVLKSLSVGYGRRAESADLALTSEDRARQTRLLITYTESSFTKAVLLSGHHRTPLPAETRTYELTGFTPENGAARFSFEEWSRNDFARFASALEFPYEQPGDGSSAQKRLIEHVRTLYRKDDLTALLPLGDVDPLALPGESYKLALTPGLIAHVFRRKQLGQPDEELLPDPAPLLEGRGSDQGGYIVMDGKWWIPSGRTFFDPAADIAAPSTTAAQERGTARQHFYLPRKVTDPFGHGTQVSYDTHALLPTRSADALGNMTLAVNDYRVLQPWLVTDPNRNRTAVAFDALGMVVATAVMGKEELAAGDLLEGFDRDLPLASLQTLIADPRGPSAALLGKATSRIVHDLQRYQRTGQPAFAATLARETHFFDPDGGQSKIQISFVYSDGFGRELQRKIQAEAGHAPQRQVPVALPAGDIQPGGLVRDSLGNPVQAHTPHRWVGTGRTVFNNKGKPVKKYEPFFSATHLYEPEREMTDTGVSPVLFYDPVERVVATLHPNHTYEKAVFDAWRKTTHDVNDTVAATSSQSGDPRTDPDITGYVHEYFNAQPAGWQTWYTLRIAGQLGAAELDAAQKAAAHAGTPAVAHLDALGRTFLTIAHNKYERNGAPLEEKNAARVELDVEGNQREVRDAMVQNGDQRGRAVMRYDYDMLGSRIYQTSMEAGERWMLNDATGKPIRVWDSRRFTRRMTYDELRRPTGLYVSEEGTERLAERTVYGESLGDANNHRTRVHQVFDGAGIVTNVTYDFKGNLRESRRDLLPSYQEAADWLQAPEANDGSFTSHRTYDALGRPLTVTSPDGSVYRPSFNAANLLDKVDVSLRSAASSPFVTHVDYNAKGQRERIAYGNGAVTTYEYDPLTFRLRRLTTTRPASVDAAASQVFQSATVVQELHYSYDPTGNLTRIEDSALRTVFHASEQVAPAGRYTYDALYQLIEAQGREHIGQVAHDPNPPEGNFRDHPFAGNHAHPNDLQALRNYTEGYEYDAAGNIVALRHLASGGGWTRRYGYEEDSLLEAGKKSNRLTRTTLGNGGDHIEVYTHDAHGNITSMPHLAELVWDFEDQLQHVDLGGGGAAYYVYDASGQRARKVIESRNGLRSKERIYLGGFEIYREFDGDGAALLERESLHVMDDKQRLALVETQTVDHGVRVDAPESLLRYQLGNHLGSASVELDEDGALISYEEYHPYGTTAFQAGRSAAEVSLKRYRYTGKERDEESGLGYHSARYYSPWLGRWTAADPGGLIDGPNLYRYGRNSPVVLNDPSGMDPPNVSNNDPNDPNNYVSLEDFRAGAAGPWADETLRAAWESRLRPSEVSLPPAPPPAPVPPPANPPTSSPGPSESNGWQLFNNPIWNTVTNNTVSGTTALAENSWIGVYTLPTLSRGLSRLFGASGLSVGLRLEDALAAPATAAPRLLAPVSGLGGISRASAFLAPLGVVSNSMSLRDAISPPADAPRSTGLERMGEGVSSTAGLFSSTVGTMGLAGAGLNAAGATTAGGWLVSSATAAGPAAAVAGAGAGGYAAGRLLDAGVGGLMNLTGASGALDRARGISRPAGQQGNYSLSGMSGDIAAAADRGAVSVLRRFNLLDTSRPEYTQTLGWRLGELLPSWMQ
jgi:RHS repeat-associated protein